MTTLDLTPNTLRVVATDSLGSEEGLAARAAGATASELHAITQGGRGTHSRILQDKLNGAKFRGNEHTRRGHEREDFLVSWAGVTVEPCNANIALIGHHELSWLLATPDGLGDDFGVEVKSHDFGWDCDDVPADHYDQMQGGMAVTGFGRWLYVWEVMGEDGTPTLAAPQFRWVERDEKRIAKLIREGQKFMDWRAAGAPIADDDLPPEVDDALAIVVASKAVIAPHKKALEAAQEVVRAHAAKAAAGSEDGDGAKGAGTRGHFTYSVTPGNELDEVAWADSEPESYAEYLDLRTRLAAAEKAAAALYFKPKSSTRLNIYPSKDAA
ncbi:hypothetical protein [Microbacterium sp. J1-1]|uniref:hypothetical protein n=1 Tax=Microbacterium sp. J1-1 TaxID=2992441 RepID=UPI0021140FAD|nr:hypothetical protein [Microbacterium sp. J1-1]UUE19351.1 hypothetical protein LRQ07_11070 [Microbacterium sp. J1-1]